MPQDTGQSPFEQLFEDYDQQSAQTALESLQSEAEALDPKELQERIPREIVFCLDAGRDLMTLAAEDRASLLTLPGIDEALLKKLGTSRLALWAAQVAVELSLEDALGTKLQEAAEALKLHRRRLFGLINYVWPDDQEMQTLLAQWQRGRGYLDLANDGLGLGAVLGERKREAEAWVGETKLEELLQKTQSLAAKVMEYRQAPKESQEADRAKERRDRLYTLYANTYNQIAKGGRFLFEGEDQARFEQYAPLYSAYLRRVRVNTPTNPTASTTTVTPPTT